jgi:NDP-sugar pyrophosphorylase family protein
MQAMLFSAGLGTRLRPLTENLPKALIPVAGKPLLQWNIEKLRDAGCSRIIVNVHHFPEKIRDFLLANRNFGVDISISDESEEILDTGGGLLKAAPYFNPEEIIIAHNVDVISNADLKALINYHTENEAMATLVVRDRSTQRYLLFDNRMALQGWANKASGEARLIRDIDPVTLKYLAFSGIHVINPGLIPLIKQTGKFSVIETYLSLASVYNILGFEDHSTLWMDVGKHEQLQIAEQVMREKTKC